MKPKPKRHWIRQAARKFSLRMWSKMTVEEVHTIRIVDVKGSENFQATIAASLKLLQNTDRRRFLRVTQNLDWIVNQSLSTPGAEYWHWARACVINFEDSWPGRDEEFSVGFHAGLLVHEATHAYLEGRGITYEDSNRARIEKLCVTEQNRWAATIDHRDLGEKLHHEFDEADWDFSWKGRRGEHFRALLRNATLDFGKQHREKPVRKRSASEAERSEP